MFTKNYGRFLQNTKNMIFPKKLCLESFIEVGPQIISTKNRKMFVENLIFDIPVQLSLVSVKFELRGAFIVIIF